MSAAVKLALGETQLAQNTRDFLEENGVCLDAFNQVSFDDILRAKEKERKKEKTSFILSYI